MTKEGTPDGRGPIAREINRWLLELLACPECLASVQETGAILTCSACGREYSIVDGVPQLLPAALTGGGPGAVPPFGNLFGLPVLVDEALTRSPEIAFNAGSNAVSMTMRSDDFVRLSGAAVHRFARE